MRLAAVRWALVTSSMDTLYIRRKAVEVYASLESPQAGSSETSARILSSICE